MKTKVLILLLIISLGINVGLVVTLVLKRPMARRFEERDIAKRSWRRGGLGHKLNLGENQLKAIEAMQETTFVKMQTARETLKIKRDELINILKNPQPDKSRLQTLIKEIADLQAGIELGFSEHILQMKKALTPEQQQQFFELFKGRFGDREMPPLPPKHLRQRNRFGPE
jgi:Spy/CpxP family protein refolding chaperone